MTETQPTRDDFVLGYTAFGLFVAGTILPFFVSRKMELNPFLAIILWESIAIYLGLLGRRIRIGRIAWRSALVLVLILLVVFVLMWNGVS